MSNTLRLACAQPVLPKVRLYVAEEPGALLVRHGTFKSLKKAVHALLKMNWVVDYELRQYSNGVERLIRGAP